LAQEAHFTGAHTGFSHKYNTDDVLLRAVIVGLINSLNYQIYYENIISDTEVQTVRVPFFYAFSGDERFMQDYFSNWSDCAPSFIEGNYDPIPRGSVTLSGVNILAGNQTSRFVRGYYDKEENGELRRYNSYLNSIPVSMSFNVKILVDSTIDAFKINQEIMRVFYKTLVFRVSFSGTVVPSQAGFSESYVTDKLFEYTYGENSRITLSFDIEVETYFPIFDKKQEMFAGNKIEKVSVNVSPTSSASYNYTNGVAPSATASSSAVVDSTFGITDAAYSSNNSPGTPDADKLYNGDYWV
jgi:hypothetical protein